MQLHALAVRREIHAAGIENRRVLDQVATFSRSHHEPARTGSFIARETIFSVTGMVHVGISFFA